MNTPFPPIVVEQVLNAPIERVWRAISERDEMKQWTFELTEFEARKGFCFEFSGGPPDRIYRHLCEVVDVIPGRKLSYTWRYEGYEGNSLVSFELFEEGANTRLRLTHEGIHTFPVDNPDLAGANFQAGWNAIVTSNLPRFLATP